MRVVVSEVVEQGGRLAAGCGGEEAVRRLVAAGEKPGAAQQRRIRRARVQQRKAARRQVHRAAAARLEPARARFEHELPASRVRRALEVIDGELDAAGHVWWPAAGGDRADRVEDPQHPWIARLDRALTSGASKLTRSRSTRRMTIVGATFAQLPSMAS